MILWQQVATWESGKQPTKADAIQHATKQSTKLTPASSHAQATILRQPTDNVQLAAWEPSRQPTKGLQATTQCQALSSSQAVQPPALYSRGFLNTQDGDM